MTEAAPVTPKIEPKIPEILPAEPEMGVDREVILTIAGAGIFALGIYLIVRNSGDVQAPAPAPVAPFKPVRNRDDSSFLGFGSED